MRTIIGAAFVSLDGVMQAPGGTTEDPTDGFKHSGWLPPYSDEASAKTVGDLFDRSFDLLLGRRTYDIFAAFWPNAEGDGEADGRDVRPGAQVCCHARREAADLAKQRAGDKHRSCCSAKKR